MVTVRDTEPFERCLALRIAIAQVIVERLSESGVSLTEFAMLVGVSESKASYYISGLCNFDLATISRIEARLQISFLISYR